MALRELQPKQKRQDDYAGDRDKSNGIIPIKYNQKRIKVFYLKSSSFKKAYCCIYCKQVIH